MILLFIRSNKIIEGYDARYTDTTFPVCAEFCKTTANCYGFGYDKKNNVCYPSQLTISGKPLDSIFKGQYSYGNAVCNKVTAIENSIKNASFVDRRANAVYVCSENKDEQPSYYFHNKGTFKNIGEGKNIDNIFEVEDYEVRPYHWPRNRFDYNQIDLLMKERENQLYTPENVTDVNRIIQYPKREAIIVPQLNKTLVPDFNLLETIEGLNPFKLLKPNKRILLKDNPDVEFIEHNEYNTGKYMNDYKCVKDISQKSCLEYCVNNPKCVGVEWNPVLNNDLNICCPYSTYGSLIKRDNNKKTGKFYEKII